MNYLKDIAAILVSLATLTGLVLHCWRDKKRFAKLDEQKADER